MPPTTSGRRPLGQRGVDLAVREPHVVADRERLGHRDDPDQPVLEPRPLLGGRRAGQGLKSLVDLQRVAGDRHRVLPALAEQVGKRDRDPGLPDPGRPEYRDDVHAMRLAPSGSQSPH